MNMLSITIWEASVILVGLDITGMSPYALNEEKKLDTLLSVSTFIKWILESPHLMSEFPSIRERLLLSVIQLA